MSDPSEPNYQPRKWPDDFLEGWSAAITTDGSRTRHLVVGARGANHGPRVLVTTLVVVPVGRGAITPPVLSETYEDRQDGLGQVTGFVQAILDAAWDAGMRPSQQRDATEELKAVRYHLEDMRALAFDRPKP